MLDLPRLRDEGLRRDLSEVEDEEDDILDKAFDVRIESRLGCQAKIEGDVDVEISDESFQAFYDEHPNLADAARKMRAKAGAEEGETRDAGDQGAMPGR